MRFEIGVVDAWRKLGFARRLGEQVSEKKGGDLVFVVLFLIVIMELGALVFNRDERQRVPDFFFSHLVEDRPGGDLIYCEGEIVGDFFRFRCEG